MRIDKKREMIIFSAIFIIVLGSLVFLFPYSGDDWAWGSSIGVERLENLFRDYNGRYLGNIVVLILTRSNILRTVVITLTLYGLIYLGRKYIVEENTKITGIYLMALLLVFMPRDVWMQSVVWTAGYSNYVISMLLIFIYFIYTKKIFKEEVPVFKNTFIIPLFILGIATTLFVEHVTLYCVAMGIFVIIFTKIRFKKIYATNISYLVGSIFGTFLMFSNGAYSKIAEGTETYRSIPKSGGFITKAFESYFKVVYKQLAYNNVVLNIAMAIIIVVIAMKFIDMGKERAILAKGIMFIIVAYATYSTIGVLNPEWKMLLKYTDVFNGIFSIVYYLALIGAGILFIENAEQKRKTLFLLGSLAILVGPLFFVNPIGPRCFFGNYIIFILIVAEFFEIAIGTKKSNGLKTVMIGMIGVQMIFLFSVYGYIYKINNERLKAVKIGIETKQEEIIIPKLPYKKYVWTGDPFSFWTDRFKLFYSIPEEVKVKTVELKAWKK
ncbi:MAG: DUF6056 family protein [Clostridium sp.]|uniref:DUF6056 family protein n=1 Tax=Clostridium sp. TaxID=1506 RepID=UPI003F2B72C4